MIKLQTNSESINTFSISRFLLKIVAALVFGTAFYYLQEIVQPHLAGYSDGFCCERCSNILYDQAQPIYAVCAGIVFFTLTFFIFNGWKSLLQMILISFIIFQIYTVFALWSAVNSDECTALILPRGLPMFISGIALLLETGSWSLICIVPILIFKLILFKRTS